MQRSLVKKGYFIINKDFDEIGRNNRNLITPTLPISVFNQLNEKFLDRVGDHAPYNRFVECKRSYLDKTKLFIKLNYNLLKIISSNKYTNPKQKIMWLGFYTRCYKNYMLQGREDFNVGKYSYSEDSSFSFISSYRELADMNSCNTKHLSKSIRALEELGFIKTQNIYVRKRYSDNADCRVQERQDQSLWKITLSLPDECISELEKVKNRSNLKVKDIKAEVATIENTLDPKLIEDCLILGGIKFNLNLEQSSLLKSIIVDDNDDDCSGVINCNGNIDAISPLPHAAPCDKSYIDSVMEELNIETTWKVEDKLEKSFRVGDSKFLSDEPKNLSTSSSLEELDEKIEKNDGVKSDPHVAKSGLLLNKDFLLKIKDIKSNLGATPKVLFNNFLKRFSKDESDENVDSKKDDIAKDREFNIHSELIREKLKILPKDKADKARKFAYSLVSKGLAKGYAASLSKHELAKQIIHHAATWKPTKLGCVSREKEIDAALSVAWKKIISGTWQVPLELAKAKILQYEFNAYRRKYQESGVLSHEAKALESDVNNLLGGWCDLVGKITDGVNTPATLEDNMLSIRDVDVYSSINVPLELGLEERVCQQRSYPSEDLALDGSFVFDLAIDQGSHQFDYDYPEMEERSNCLNISLSHIPEQQKYLKVIPSDTDDSIKLETINGKEYFVKLKELEMNKDGDFVMTLSPSSGVSFENRVTALSGYDNLLLSDKKLSFDNTDEQVTQLSRKEFTRTDGALANILTNLQRKIE
jgi:DNA-binding Lrp family transcriptional regulator